MPPLLLLMMLSGLLLAFHFWSWIASLRFTSVASSGVLVSLKPVFAWGIAALWLREHPSRTEVWGILLAWLFPSIGEVPPVTAVIGGVMVLGGITLSVRHGEVRG